MSNKKNRKRAPKPAADSKAPALDGFTSYAAKLGAQPNSGNLLSQASYQTAKRFSKAELDAAYRGSWIVGAIIDMIAEDMTREGIEINGLEPDEISLIKTAQTRMKIAKSLNDGIRWGRLYGGAVGVLQVSGAKLGTPLDINRIAQGGFKGVAIYDRYQIDPIPNKIIKEGPEIGMPEFYRMTTGHNVNEEIHHSRVLRFIGVELPWEAMEAEQFWGASVIERIYDRLIAYDTATFATANLLTKAHLRTIMLDGLREIMAAGGVAEENLFKWVGWLSYMQNSEGITLLDKNDDSKSESYTFAGLEGVLGKFEQQLCGAAGISGTRLFGMPPVGFNSTGESDTRNYYDTVKSAQESRLRDPQHTILACTYQSEYGKPLPDTVTFSFVPLWQLSAVEKADIAQKNETTVQGAADSGIIDQATALKELKASSETTGTFSNITQEHIDEAEEEPPEAVELEPGAEVQPSEQGELEAEPADAVSLNGAQVTSMVAIAGQIASGELSRESGLEILTVAFPISLAQAQKIIGPVTVEAKAAEENTVDI